MYATARDGLRKQAELNATLAHKMTPFWKWTYLATNLPFLVIGCQVLVDGPAWGDRFVICGSRVVCAAVVLVAGVASIVFHGTQCRCWPPDAVYDAVPGSGWAFKRAAKRVDPAFLEASIFTNIVDVVCAVSLGVFLFACNGGLASAQWLTVGGPTLALLFASALLKRARRYVAYAAVHAVWHLAAARVAALALRGDLVT